MKKTYSKPVFGITQFENSDVITLSGLIFGGDKGESQKESFGSLFGNN